jgi:hypothetical protein
MATLKKDEIGKLDINLVQGNNKTIALKFEEKGLLDELIPIDLTIYSEIKMDVKRKVNVNELPFISWTVGDGLTISGTDNNFLTFEFAQEFFETQIIEWFYDIKFVKNDKVSHMIKGVIRINLVITD